VLARLHVPLSWRELARRTLTECVADDVLSLAAQQAYYFFFALFPALLTLISIASFFPVANLMDEILRLLGRMAPPEVLKLVADQLVALSNSNHGGILTLAFLLTLWSSSGAMVSIVTTLNAAYDITEARAWWRVRLIAIALTLGLAFFIIISISLVLVGPSLAEHLAARLHLSDAFTWAWWILQWPVVFVLVSAGIGIVYYFAPDAEQEWIWITPGSVLATLLWIAVSLGFKVYLKFFDSYNETYGTIATIIVLLTWLYLSGLAILVGAELNAEIEHASPYGKEVGEKVAGERRRIGIAAQRDLEERKARGEIPVPTFPDEVNCDIDEGPRQRSRFTASDALIGTAALMPSVWKLARKVRAASQRDSAANDRASRRRA